MIENIPLYIPSVFFATVLLTVFFFLKACNQSRIVLIILLGWIIVQSVIGYNKIYAVTDSFPPRLILLIAPPLFLIIFLFINAKGRKFIDSLDIQWLTLLHFVRVPVEATLYLLFMQKLIPQIMTFDGNNFDIISGISAPAIAFFGFIQPTLNKKILILWNIICLALLINIVVTAILSFPFPFQQLAFDQPNIGLLYFPFMLLPGVIVPLVLFSHLVTIRQLLIRK